MMQRIWIAALLGIVLGIGLAAAPQPTATPQPQVLLQSNPVSGRLNTSIDSANQSAQYLLSALIVALLLGTLFFFVAKRRTS